MRKRFLWSRMINALLLFSLIFPGTIVPAFAQDEVDTPFVDAPIAVRSVANAQGAGDLQAAALDASFTINVNTLVDEWSTDTNTKASSKCSLREALQATVSGNPQGNQGCGAASIANFSEYTINMLPGTYLLSNPDQLPNITKKISINGNGALTIDGNGKNNRAEGIFIVGGGELILQKLKLQHGRRPFGGAIWIKGSGSVRVTEVEFFRNIADNGSGNGDGGAVAIDVGSFICVKSKFQENTARQSGGAISSGGVQVLLDRCEFFNNHAELNGGAYAGHGGSELTHPIIRDSKFHDNWVYQTTVPATWPGQYQFNDDSSGGGAIYNSGYMELERTEIFKNYTQRSKGGGAIYNQGDLRLLDVAISDNKARIDGPVPNTLGGAILNDSTLIIRRTSIHHNEAKFGGAILNRTGGKLWLVNSTVAENLAITGGGVENGHNFVMNGSAAINQGGEINIWHSTVVRANANNPGSSVSNNGNGSVYMANSIMDTPCYGWLGSWGGNIFKEPCPRVSADNGVDLTLKDVLVKNVGEIKLEGLANNGGPNLPEAEFLSIKVSNGSPALDLGEDDYCIDPVLQPLFLANKDQIQGQRPQGPKCDAGALEVGSLPPEFFSDQPEGAGFQFPLTVFGKVWSSSQKLVLKNKGGGSIAWSMVIENDAGGTYTLESGPTSGGLGRNQSQELTFSCTPTSLGWQEGMILIKTDLPDMPEIRYPISCRMISNPQDPSTLRSQPPGPISTGSTPPSGTAKTQLAISNQGANPMAATVNLKDALAQTIKFVVNLGAVNAAGTAADVTIPPGGEMKIEISCTPSEAGLFYNTLVITTNDPTDPLLEYDISCESVPPAFPEPLAMSNKYAELPQRQIMGMAFSPDGKQLLAGHWENNEIAVHMVSDPTTGIASLQSKFSQPNMNTITGIRYSSDGKNVYYSSSGGAGVGVATVESNGTLSATQVITTGTTYVCGISFNGNFPILKFCPIDAMHSARALDISPDDQNLYVTGNSDATLTVLERNADNGTLYYSQKFTRTIEGVDLLGGAFGVLASKDGKNVYVAARDDDALVVFSRNSNGTLRYLTHYRNGENGISGLDGAIEIAVSPDGKFLYVASLNSDAVQIFERNPTDGYLTPVEAMAVGDGPYHVSISHDAEGSRLLVALWTGDGVKAYARNLLNGKLSAIPNQADLAMDGAVYLVANQDDQNVYTALFEGKAVQQLRSQRRAPLLQNISPASVKAGAANFTLTVNGAGFYNNSTVVWNGTGLATTFVSDHQLKATVPAALVSNVGSANVLVRTAAPGGGDSVAQALAITAPNAAPIPSVESLSPAAANYGGEPLNVIINGAGFTAQSQALLNGSPVKTTYVNSVMLLAELAASDVGEPGPLVISVVNNAVVVNVVAADITASQLNASQSSKPVKFSVAAANSPAQPTISGFQPASIAAGSGEQWITVKGYSFSTLADASSLATWNGEPRETVVQDDNTLFIHLRAADVTSAGKPQVTIQTPGVDDSAPKNFTILAAGQNAIAQVSSLYVDSSGALQLVVIGSDFVNGAQIRMNGVARTTTVVNAYVATAAVSYADLQKGGLVQVVNPNASASNGQILMPLKFVFLPMIQR